MRKTFFILGLAMVVMGYAYAQDPVAIGKKIAEGETNTPFGKYSIEVRDEPVMLEGELVKSYKITYEKSPVSVIVLVDKEEKCKNYIVVSEGLSIMYTCNGQYFGVTRIDRKYSKDGFVTETKNLNMENYYRQKVLSPGKQEELYATSLIASYYPMLIK